MSSWLGAIAKGAAYLYGGGGDNDEVDTAQTAQNDHQEEDEQEVKQHSNTGGVAHQYVPRNVYASAKGELWKFNPKREEFKLLVDEVQALVIEHDSDDFVSSFQIIRKSGDLLFSETICNDLQIQYNKSNHSMVFAMYNAGKDRLEILSFIFTDDAKEEEFKMAIAIKLYETNRQESFERLLKTKDIAEHEQSWMTQAYEMDVDNDEEYDESETDLQELCDDVTMLDMNDYYNNNNDDNDEFDVASDDGEFDEEEKEEVEDRRRNKWEDAATKAYSDEEDLEQHTDKVLPPSPFKDEKDGGKGAKNKHITGSKVFNRTYVVREMKAGASALGYFKHNDENELEYQGKIAIKDKKNRYFSPTKVMQHKSDRSMLLLSKDKPGKVNVLNLDKGKVVEEWQTGDADDGDDGVNVVDIAPLSKHDEMTDNPMVYGLSKNSMFQIDGRIPTKSKIIDSKQNTYKSIHNLSAMATSGNGFIATAANDGKIRLHDTIEKRAKTCLPGLGNGVKYIEISDDGLWILATCNDYIMVIPTQVPGTERTGFEGRGMGKLKPHPFVLRLKVSDIQKYKLRKVEFTPAHFDQGKGINEHWIISSTGPYIIKWNFNKLKKCGIINSYSIRKAHSKVVHNEFRFNHDDDLLVSETNSVYAQHSAHKK
mmetsp:Transcript_5382/g.9006  ORF Transcript_5382/g.9006 Transcript_5382/m.9006 type:complete len:652 (-) Transcript_5382:187-2142(-)|eukprot:CAMPEP_0197047636 /NCGR_PEP_ID=MMETSP1384-20130603/23103_1 /TAXON_ID=29189 /ORGANISM="Ammonia sp." /LENGTH=651 /DNA_ID=CAMNT_0042479597 /DNA_START=40 /DNA_END=1995 /DNA_ORIENTATION=-